MGVLLHISRGGRLYDTDDAGRLPLHCAAAAGQREIAEQLIRMKADPNALNADGLTAAKMAENFGHADIAKFLQTAMDSKPGRGREASSPEEDGEEPGKKNDSGNSPEELS